ncbi:MAG: hypothetical protein ACOY42_04960 [Pseudomonadota bacterium]
MGERAWVARRIGRGHERQPAGRMPAGGAALARLWSVKWFAARAGRRDGRIAAAPVRLAG